MLRFLCRAAILAALVVASAPAAASDEPPPSPRIAASMQCDRAIEPGRVRCSVETHVEGALAIAWADVAIVALPEFAAALKGRIGPADATARDPQSTKWAFGLVAKRTGQGEARARVRAIVCETPPASPPARCTPVTVEVHAILGVGS